MLTRILFAAAAALASGVAFAHVSIEPKRIIPGAGFKATLGVPHGCAGAATNVVRVTIPEGVIDIRPMPKAGWTLTTRAGAYARSYDLFGKPVAEGVKEIVWSGGSLPDDQFDEFSFRARAATQQPGPLHFATTQECGSSKVEWSEIAAPGVDAHALKSPAPTIAVLAQAAGPAAGAAAAEAPVAHHGHDGAAAAPANGQTFKAGAIVVDAPWTRATPKGAQVAGGFMRVTNTGSTPDTLIGGSFALSKRFELHEMSMNGGVMRMRAAEGGIIIPPGATVELKPGSYHAMMLDLSGPVEQGAPIKGVLTFEKAGDVAIEYAVARIGAAAPDPTPPQQMHMQHQSKP